MKLANKRLDKVCKLVYAGKDGKAIKKFNTLCPVEPRSIKNKPLRTALSNRKIILDSGESDTEPDPPEEEAYVGDDNGDVPIQDEGYEEIPGFKWVNEESQLPEFKWVDEEFIDTVKTGWTQRKGKQLAPPPAEIDYNHPDYAPFDPEAGPSVPVSEKQQQSALGIEELVYNWMIYPITKESKKLKLYSIVNKEIHKHNEVFGTELTMDGIVDTISNKTDIHDYARSQGFEIMKFTKYNKTSKKSRQGPSRLKSVRYLNAINKNRTPQTKQIKRVTRNQTMQRRENLSILKSSLKEWRDKHKEHMVKKNYIKSFHDKGSRVRYKTK